MQIESYVQKAFIFICENLQALLAPKMGLRFYTTEKWKRKNPFGQFFGACHTIALPITLKKYYLRAKEKLWELKYFIMQKYNLQKIL
jgi:hypothetical protein